MFHSCFKCLAAAIFIFALPLFSGAQQIHFVYLQTENTEQFYVKINGKIVSSSAGGYLILPKLTDGDYKLSIGFPKKEFPEEEYQISIDKKNEGFLLKNMGEKGWGLFNLQSYKIVMGGNKDTTVISPKKLQDDPFSTLLANVVKDSSILQKNEPVKEVTVTQRPDTVTGIDSIIAKANSTNAKVDSTIAVTEKAKLPLLPPVRFLSKKSKDGREMIYIDHNRDLNDTIRIFIPSRKSITKTDNVDTGVIQTSKSTITPLTDTASAAIEQPVTQMKSDTSLVPAEKKNIPDSTGIVSQEKKSIIENPDSVVSKKTDVIKQAEINSKDSLIQSGYQNGNTKKDDMVVFPKVTQSSTTNSDCKAFASNEDFLKLRKKMASENSDDNMNKIAKKAFHSKCFSTEQIKNLSFLFLTDEGKYMFFDLAYPFTSDSDQFNTLQSQLTDSYYVNRFKAMIHK